ncbi:hypothetical protein LZ31DRAFT_77866 [Colletotrichum somersetense]|nr:hypothetical protein LZ31DRAFT_77866 [Colletotrichum somersetense]
MGFVYVYMCVSSYKMQWIIVSLTSRHVYTLPHFAAYIMAAGYARQVGRSKAGEAWDHELTNPELPIVKGVPLALPRPPGAAGSPATLVVICLDRRGSPPNLDGAQPAGLETASVSPPFRITTEDNLLHTHPSEKNTIRLQRFVYAAAAAAAVIDALFGTKASWYPR